MAARGKVEQGQPADLDFTGKAAGPAPWRLLVPLLIVWTGLTWAFAEAGAVYFTAAALISGMVGFWLLLPKAESVPDLPKWMLLPLSAAFIAGIFLAGMLSAVDRNLTAIAYGLWFVLWLQFGLWLRVRVADR